MDGDPLEKRLILAIAKSQTDEVRELVPLLATQRDTIFQALRGAIAQGNATIVKILLDRDEVNVNYRKTFNSTILRYAVKRGNAEIVKLLLDRGAQVNVEDLHRSTILHYAICQGNADIVKHLLDHGALTNVNETCTYTDMLDYGSKKIFHFNLVEL